MTAEELFAAALERRDPADRAAFLDSACGGDARLRARVEGLLRSHEKAGSFLEHPLFEGPTPAEPSKDVVGTGTVIGPYKLLQRIGEGGMGTVYMAEQSEPMRRRVALKVVRSGMGSTQVVARFEAERQAMALMDHPNVAKVFDAGTVGGAEDRPYFAMELVKGVPITVYCDEQRLTPRQRLELFVPVCQAVQHAHQKGIIHRDLKPSNVLVALYDGKPVPKVIDFGVARAMGTRLTEKTLFTELGQVVGTLQYMSPEQAQLNQLDVDTRSDVFSLGVLLYELLTGTTPLERERLKDTAFLEMLRLVREEEPPTPSARLSSTDSLPSIAASRSLLPKRLCGFVRGDLDWIVMKCLEKDRVRRYETANGLAMDLLRYLAEEPVLAGPPSAWYRARKFARRNKIGLAVGGSLLLFVALLVAGVGWTLRDRTARRTETERVVGEALAEADRWQGAERWPDALSAARRAEGLLAAGEARGDLRRIVEERRADLEMVVRLEDARLRATAVKDGDFDEGGLDPVYDQLFRDYGIDVGALPADEAARRIRSRSVARELAVAVDDWVIISRVSRGKGSLFYNQLQAVARGADPDPGRARLRDIILKPNRAAVLEFAASAEARNLSARSLETLSRRLVQDGSVKEAVELLKDAQRRYPGDFWINHTLAVALQRLVPPPWDEVLRFYTAALAIRPQSPGAHLNVAFAHGQRGDHEEGAAASRAAIELKPDYAQAHCDLGDDLMELGKLDEAVIAFRAAIRLNPSDASNHYGLSLAFNKKGATPEALAEAREAARLVPERADFHYIVGINSPFDEAIVAFREAVRLDPEHAEAHCNLAFKLQDKLELAEALLHFRRGHEAGSRRPHWPYPSAQWVAHCARLVELDAGLPAVLDGRLKVAGIDRLEYAQMAHLRQRLLAAARLFADAYAEQPDHMDCVYLGGHTPSCTAALVGAGKGADAQGLDESERARWRLRAVDWQRAELAVWAKRLETDGAKARRAVRETLLHRQADADLAGIRDPEALAKLPEPEREPCRQLWIDVAKMLAAVQEAPAADGKAASDSGMR